MVKKDLQRVGMLLSLREIFMYAVFFCIGCGLLLDSFISSLLTVLTHHTVTMTASATVEHVAVPPLLLTPVMSLLIFQAPFAQIPPLSEE